MLQDREASEPLCGLGGDHGAAVVAEQRARQAALEQGLAEAVDEAVRRLVQVPLDMADQARAVVEDRQQDRPHPLPSSGEGFVRAVVKVEMPESADVLRLVAAHLALLALLQGAKLSGPQLADRLPSPT